MVEADDFCIIDQHNELYTEREYNFRGDTHFFQLSGVKCDKNTIEQFTGLYDKNGKEIYEGDIIEDNELSYEVCWYDDIAAFMAEDLESEKPFLLSDLDLAKTVILDNIHDTLPHPAKRVR